MKKIIGGMGGAVVAGLAVLMVGMQVHAEPTRATMPDITKLVHYTTVTRGEVTEHIMTTREAIEAVKRGDPIPNGTHFALVDYRDGKVFRYFIMEKGENWGQDYAENRRTADWPVFPNPGCEPFQRRQHAFSHLGEVVLDARRHFWEIVADKKPIPLQIAQGQSQHALRNTFDAVFELGKTQAVASRQREVRYNQDGPLVAKPRQDRIRRARPKAFRKISSLPAGAAWV